MPDPLDFTPPNFPSFSGYVTPRFNMPPVPADIPATGTGDWFTSGVMSGFHSAISEGARALQAGAQLAGSPGAAQSLSDFAEEHHRHAQSYARPDLEASPWSPAGIAYQVARMVPMGLAALGGGAAATVAAPEVAGAGLAGAAATMFLPAAGANVERQIRETGELTTPGKALALGVPEAIVQGYLPGRLESFFGRGILRGISHAAATQGFAGGATEFLTQQLGDPNRDMADRAAAVGSQALSGAALGGIIGGVFGGVRALAGKPAGSVTNEDLSKATDQALEPRQLTYQPTMRAPLTDIPSGEIAGRIDILQRAPKTQESVEELRQLLQEQQRRAAETAAVETAKPPPQLQLPPPAIKAEPSLEEMPPAELWTRFNKVQEHLALNPQDPTALGAFKVLGDEFTRRAVEAPPLLPPAAPEPPKLLAPPPTIEGPPLGDMPPAELWARLNAVRSHLAVNPEDTNAQRASELLGQEFSRRVEETAKAAVPEPAAPAVAEPVVAAAPEPAAPVPVLNFTAKLTESAFKKGMAQVEASPLEVQAQLQQQLIDVILERGDKPLTVGLKKWGKAFDILTPEGELKEEFIPERPPEAPPGVTEEAPPEEPAAATPEAPPEAPAAAAPEAPPEAPAAPAPTPAAPAPHPLDIPEFLRRAPPEVQAKHAPEVETIAKLLPNVERNPGLADVLNTRIDNLRTAIEAETQRPADAVASPDLTPSPRAEAVSAPTGDLGARLEDAQSALSKLKKMLGNQPGAAEAIEQHAKWLADVNKAVGPDELRTVLANDPEALAAAETPGVADLGGIRQLSVPQKKQMAAYLSAQEKVLQELRAQSDSRARVVTSRDGLPVTQLDADVTDLHQRGVPLVDVADHIIEHTPDAETAEIVAKLKPFLPEDAKTVFRDGVANKEGEYFTKEKTSALYNAADATTTSIHEMVHSVMHQALEGDSAAARAMRGIYDQLKDKGNHAGITDAHEMVSEAMANPTYRDFLKSQLVRGTSLWDRIIDTVRGFIGLDPRLFNAFDRIMSHGDDLMKEQRLYPNSEWLGPDSYARVVNKGTGTAAAAADYAERSLRDKADNGLLNVKSFMRGIGLGWSNGYWLARSPEYNKRSPNISDYVNSLAMEDPRRKQIGRAAIVADRQARALPAEGQELLNRVMAASTSYGFHPERSLGDYPEIHDNPTRVQQFNATKDLWNQLGKIPGGQEAYNTWRSTMSALGNMTAVHNLQSVERSIPGLATTDSFNKFGGRDDLHNQPKLSSAFWQKELNDKIKADTVFRDQLSAQKAAIDTGLAAQFKKDQPKELVKQSRDLESQIDRLGEAIKLATDEQRRMFKEPYFHLGRKGDFFATGKLVTTPGEIDPETGKPGRPTVDQDVLSRFADHLEKNDINDVAIMRGNQHDTFYARVESPAQLAVLSKVLADAQKAGLLSKDPLASGRILDPHIFNRISSRATQDIIEQLRANRPLAPEGADASLQPALDKAHGAQIQDLQRALLGMTPETSMGRLMAHRQNVQGFSKDMLRSQGYASDVSAFSIARQSLMHEVSAAEAGMLKDVEAANRNPDVDLNTRLGLADVVGELMHGQRIRQTFVPKDWREGLRQFSNFLHIGMSPAYFPMQLSQLGITGLPELAKTHGYGQGLAAITRALSPALQVVNAIVRSPDGLTAGITREALEKAGLDPTLINKVMGMELRGALGTYTESVTARSPLLEGVTDSPMAQSLSRTGAKVANTLGMYSDLVPRLIMGLAADELYTAKRPTSPAYSGMTKEQFVDHVIDESQGYYGGALGARQTGKGGLLGASTPLMTQFMQWNIHMTNKIYHEVYDAFKGEDAQTRKEALTWLGGHAAAVTMLSGTLGLPAVSVAASVYDRLMDLVTNRDDHDITAQYRTFLANTFGKDMGEIIARGLPRAAGVDFANWGEGEIVPGTASLKVFTEKRKWEDVERDWFKSIGGPALDQMFQLGLAARDIMNGDWLEGAGRMAPGLVAGPMKAYRLGTQGWVDQHGQKLPLSSPTALDYALTAMGLKPQKQAEYQEVAREESGLRAMREASSANISQHLRQAWTQGDVGAFNTWMAEAQRWQVQHPGMVPPQVSFGRALNLHMQQLAIARGTGLPIGIQPRDIAGRGMLQYGNIPMQ